jgi:hypothetical protein
MDYLLTDTLGNILHESMINLNQDAKSYFMHKSAGDTLLLAGIQLDNFEHVYDLFLKKIDLSGGIVWEKQFVADTPFTDIYPLSVCNTFDEGYFILYLGSAAGIRYMKVNNNGDSLFSKNIGSPFYGGPSMTELHDSGFAILARKNVSGIYSSSILRLDVNGDSLWSRDIPSDSLGLTSKIIETRDHGLAILGNINDSMHNNPLCIFRFDSTGTYLWRKPLYTGVQMEFEQIQSCSDNGFIISGSAVDSMANCFLYRSDANGDSLWYKEYETQYAGILRDVFQTADGGFFAMGTLFYNGNLPGIFAVRTDSVGNVTSTVGIGSNESQKTFAIFPNPTRNFVTLTSPGNAGFEFLLYDMSGRLMREGKGEQHEITMNIGNLNSGIYLIRIYSEKQFTWRKLVVEQ